jgi:hypothetical protein
MGVPRHRHGGAGQQRIGDRPFRIVTSASAARDWLESHRNSCREFDPDDS